MKKRKIRNTKSLNFNFVNTLYHLHSVTILSKSTDNCFYITFDTFIKNYTKESL